LADESRPTIQRLLDGLGEADSAALDSLIAILYEQLRVLAHRQRRRWLGDDTLGTTALVHEAYLKLRQQKRIGTRSRDHFLALASTAMRHILTNYAEQRRTRKRGGGLEPASICDVAMLPAGNGSAGQADEVLGTMNRALEELEAFNSRACRVVECRFYGGLNVKATADALGISPTTVKRDWAFAQAWLKRELQGTV
jgi:RNA polymerase sigma factor (TIGR02999 family)